MGKAVTERSYPREYWWTKVEVGGEGDVVEVGGAEELTDGAMFLACRSGYENVLVGVGALPSDARGRADYWGWDTILLVLKRFWDDWGGLVMFCSSCSRFEVDGGVCGWARRGC